MSAPTLSAWSAVLLFISSSLTTPPAIGTPGSHKKPVPQAKGPTALGGFVKDTVLAGFLGEILFRDTVDVMSDPAALSTVASPDSSAAGQARDSSAAGRVARAVLAHRSLDKYLWLVRHAYDDTLWKGGDRAQIEQHFALIWRTSIMLYEATLSASPHRIRVCQPTADIEEFDCHDEIQHARMVPIPTQTPLLVPQHQPNIG
jgi:hypothetical protein